MKCHGSHSNHRNFGEQSDEMIRMVQMSNTLKTIEDINVRQMEVHLFFICAYMCVHNGYVNMLIPFFTENDFQM